MTQVGVELGKQEYKGEAEAQAGRVACWLPPRKIWGHQSTCCASNSSHIQLGLACGFCL